MKIDVNVYLHGGPPDPRMDQLLGQVATLGAQMAQVLSALAKEGQLMAKLDDDIADLQTKATNLTNAVDAAETVINGIGAQITAAVDAALAAGATDEQLAAITAVSTALDAKATELANAIAAGTPAAPTP